VQRKLYGPGSRFPYVCGREGEGHHRASLETWRARRAVERRGHDPALARSRGVPRPGWDLTNPHTSRAWNHRPDGQACAAVRPCCSARYSRDATRSHPSWNRLHYANGQVLHNARLIRHQRGDTGLESITPDDLLATTSVPLRWRRSGFDQPQSASRLRAQFVPRRTLNRVHYGATAHNTRTTGTRP
jgi:hypothetical protein